MKTNSILIILLLSILLLSCSSTSEEPQASAATGVFLVNEGNFSEANGSIGFYNTITKEVVKDIFEEGNETKPGGIIQSVYLANGYLFIIDQLGSKIYVLDSQSFKLISVIDEGLSTPRYMAVVNDKGYVSNWGTFDENYDLPNSYIAEIDLTSFKVSASYNCGNGAEGLIVFNENVYVANSFGTNIEVLNTKTKNLDQAITVDYGPIGFVEDKNGKVWILSSSFLSGSALAQVDLATEQVLKSFPIGPSAKSLTINGTGDELLYLSAPYDSDAEVKKVAITAMEDASSALIAASNLYGLGIDPKTGIIYLGNHNGFQGNGTVLLYEGSQLIDSFAAGVAPNGFVFQ